MEQEKATKIARKGNVSQRKLKKKKKCDNSLEKSRERKKLEHISGMFCEVIAMIRHKIS